MKKLNENKWMKNRGRLFLLALSICLVSCLSWIMEKPSLISQVQVSVVAKFRDLGGSLKTIITGNDLPYKIEGKASVKTAFGSRDFPFSKDGRINLKNL